MKQIFKPFLIKGIANSIYLFKKLKLSPCGKKNLFRVLLYHNVGDEIYNDTYNVNVSLDDFLDQMRFLSSNGYKIFKLEELINKIKKKEPIPDKSIAITFDDGYSENLPSILSILNRYAFAATFFVTINYVNGSFNYTKDNYWEYLSFFTWEQLRTLLSAGHSVGSHFYSHTNLLTLSYSEIKKEIIESRKAIANKLGINVDLFSYPYGKFDKIIKDILKKNDCLAACTSIAGKNSYGTDLYAIKRIPINPRDGISEFKKKISGCYDWIGMFSKSWF